jgi:hypothetical protein
MAVAHASGAELVERAIALAGDGDVVLVGLDVLGIPALAEGLR